MDLEFGTQIVEVVIPSLVNRSSISVQKTDGCRDHSVIIIWIGRDRMSARTFNLSCPEHYLVVLTYEVVRPYNCIARVPLTQPGLSGP